MKKVLIALVLSLCMVVNADTVASGMQSSVDFLSYTVEELPAMESIAEAGLENYTNGYSLSEDYEVIESRFAAVEEDGGTLYLLSQTLMNGGSVYITEDTPDYYLHGYSIVNPNSAVTWMQNEDGTMVLKETTETLEGRQETIETVINEIGIETFSNPILAVENAASRIRSSLYYSFDYQYTDTITAIKDGCGVCAHYAVATYIILNTEGIPCRLVYGYHYNNVHVWNEVWIADEEGGSWFVVDTVNAASGFVDDDSVYTKLY